MIVLSPIAKVTRMRSELWLMLIRFYWEQDPSTSPGSEAMAEGYQGA